MQLHSRAPEAREKRGKQEHVSKRNASKFEEWKRKVKVTRKDVRRVKESGKFFFFAIFRRHAVCVCPRFMACGYELELSDTKRLAHQAWRLRRQALAHSSPKNEQNGRELVVGSREAPFGSKRKGKTLRAPSKCRTNWSRRARSQGQ